MSELLVRQAPIVAADTAARTLTVQLLAWDHWAEVSDPGMGAYRERWARDSLLPAGRMYVNDRHRGELIGRMGELVDTPAGPTSELTIAHTRAGDDVLALVDAEVIEAVSIEFTPDRAGGEVWSGDREEVTRTRALLHGIAFAFNPAHQAPILQREEQTMTMTDQPPAEPQPVPEPPAEPEPEPESRDGLRAELVSMRGELARLTARDRPALNHARFENVGELMRAAAHDIARELPRDRLGGGVPLERVLADVTSTQVAGLVQPQQLKQLFDVIEASQPLADAAGTAPAPTSLSYAYPKVGTRPLVDIQSAQKTDIASRATTITQDTEPVVTLAGGEDTSIQVIQLSDPSYLEIQARLYAEAMAIKTDQYAYQVYNANAAHKVSIGATVPGWVPALFDLAGDILTASRRFPNRLQLSTDLWVKIGGAVDTEGRPIFTSASASNPAGTATLTGPNGDVRGLDFVVNPNLPADRGLMFASTAFLAGLGPVQTMTADVPSRLGRDYAMFRFGAFLPVDPGAMALFASGTAPAAEEQSSGSGRGKSK